MDNDFPGRPLPAKLSGKEKARRIEQALTARIADPRFQPHIQPHEFESLLFSDAQRFTASLGRPALARRFVAQRSPFATPEDIDDSPASAPSKRVLQIFPPYNKVLDGTRAAEAIGIERMIAQCHHFAAWVDRLKRLGD